MQIVTCRQCGAKNRVDERAAKRMPICGQCGTPLSISEQDANRPITVTDATFERDVLGAGDVPVLLDCWAAWCGPCRMIAPVLDELAAESAGRYRVAKLNVDENKRVPAQFRIQSIPTLLIFKRGQLVDRLVGAQPKQTIAAKLAAYVRGQ